MYIYIYIYIYIYTHTHIYARPLAPDPPPGCQALEIKSDSSGQSIYYLS